MDFGTIPGCAKPSLWKPGAEKINFMFNLVPKYEILKETESNTEYTYKIRCDLYNKNNGKFMGSGLGYASSREKKFASAPANTILKMCKKRAYIDATLSSTMASFIFTQDVVEEDDKPTAKPKPEAQKQSDAFDWSKLDLNKKPYWKDKQAPPIIKRLFAIAQKKIPDKNDIKAVFHSITNKEHSYEYTYGDIKKIDDYLNDTAPEPEQYPEGDVLEPEVLDMLNESFPGTVETEYSKAKTKIKQTLGDKK
jgi:hypothetical protein